MITPWVKKIIALVGFVGLLNLFLFHSWGSTSTILFLLGSFLFVVTTFFDREFFQKNTYTLLGSGLFLFVGIYTLFNRSHDFAQFIAFISQIGLLIGLSYLLSQKISFFRSLFEIISTPFSLLQSYLSSTVTSFFSLISTSKEPKANISGRLIPFKRIFVGLLFGIPITGLLLLLFSSADPIYGSFVKKIFTFSLPENLLFRLVFTLVITIILIPITNLTKLKQAVLNHGFVYGYKRSLVSEMSVIMTLVAIVLGSFLTIQWQYIFVSVPKETQLSQFGVATYSEYVQRGFFELLLISLIIYILAWIGLIIWRIEKMPRKTWLLPMQLFVLFEYFVFITSLFRRIWLYQQHHGWSLVRLYGGFFLLWMVFVTITLLLRHFYNKRWVNVEVSVTALLILIFGFFNAEEFIVRTHPPTVNNRVDYVYLSRMSADGYEGWKQAYQSAAQTLSKYQNTEFLDHEKRREIFYAGMILHTLLGRYEQLTQQYATEVELNQYQKALISHYLGLHTPIKDELEAELQRSPNLIPTNGKTTVELRLEEAIRRETSLKNELAQIGTKKLSETGINIRVNWFGAYEYPQPCNLLEYSQGLSESNRYSSSCRLTFYVLDFQKPDLSVSPIDRLYLWNGRESDVYSKFLTDIPFMQLLEYERIYFQLLGKIGQQPETERQVQFDVSFRTPFL